MSYCIKCGTKLEDNAIFCISCGEAVGAGHYAQQAELTKVSNNRRGAQYIDKTGVMIWSWLCLLLFWPLGLYNVIKLNQVHKIDSEEELILFFDRIKMSCTISTVLGVLIPVGVFMAEVHLIINRSR